MSYESVRTQSFIIRAEQIALIVNACYTRDESGQLRPLFRVPRRDESAVTDYHIKYEVALRRVPELEPA